MPRNRHGGKKHKRKKNHNYTNNSKKLELAENGQSYGKVLNRLGGTRLSVLCDDGIIRSGIIRGKLQKRVWMNPGDIILCTLDSMGTDRNNECYIESKYYPREVAILEKRGLIDFKDDDSDESDEETDSSDTDSPIQQNIKSKQSESSNKEISYEELLSKYESSDSEDVYDGTEFKEKDVNLDEIDFL